MIFVIMKGGGSGNLFQTKKLGLICIRDQTTHPHDKLQQLSNKSNRQKHFEVDHKELSIHVTLFDMCIFNFFCPIDMSIIIGQ